MTVKHLKRNLSEKGSAHPRTKPAEIRLEELMGAAERLFLSQGVDATTINQIVEQAHVAKGTFYHYFDSKNDMLVALEKRYTEQFLTRLQEAVDTCEKGDWEQRLRAWINAMVETYVKTYRTHDIVYGNHHHLDRSNQARNAILNQLMEIIEQGKSAGIWSPDHPRIVALLIYSGVHGATDDIIATKTKDCSRFAQSLSDTCLNMLSPITQTR